MFNTFNILQLGVVGVIPRILFLDTTENEQTVFSTGFINSIESAANIHVDVGDFIYIRYDNGTKQQIAFPQFGDNGIITLVAGTGSAGGDIFNSPLTLYFSTGGNDAFSGTINTPLATLAQAVTNANVLLNAGARRVVIKGLGIGIDTSNLSFTVSGIEIDAPGYQLNPVTGDAITVNLAGFSGGSYINILLASCTVASGANAVNLINLTDGNNNVTRFVFNGPVTGNVMLTKNCEFYSTIVLGTLTALEAHTILRVLYGVSLIEQPTRLNLLGVSYGANGCTINGDGQFTNVWRYPMRKTVALTGNYTLGFGDSGVVFVNASTNTYTVTLPQVSNQGTVPFLVGYESEFLNLSTGSIAFAVQGSDVLIGSTSIDSAAERGIVIEQAAGTWVVSTESGGGGGGSGGGITWNAISGTSQTAAANNGYVVQNAAQTTLTLPAIAALGSVVYIQGLGAAGWNLQANTGQTIQIGSSATSSGGVVTSANQWDALGVVCVQANTTWAMLATVTSGFAIS